MADRKTLTRQQRRAIADYTGRLQEQLRLCVWRVTIASRFAPKKREAWAVIYIQDEAHVAEISIGRDFLGLSRTDQRQVLVHELCHLVLEPVSWAIDRNSKPLGKNNHAAGNLHPAMEVANDDFAFLLAEHLPLPPKGWLATGGSRG